MMCTLPRSNAGAIDTVRTGRRTERWRGFKSGQSLSAWAALRAPNACRIAFVGQRNGPMPAARLDDRRCRAVSSLGDATVSRKTSAPARAARFPAFAASLTVCEVSIGTRRHKAWCARQVDGRPRGASARATLHGAGWCEDVGVWGRRGAAHNGYVFARHESLGVSRYDG